MSDHGHFSSYEGHKERRTGKILGAFSRMYRALKPVAPVAQRYHVTSDTLGREFDPAKRDFLTEKLKNENKNAQRVEND